MSNFRRLPGTLQASCSLGCIPVIQQQRRNVYTAWYIWPKHRYAHTDLLWGTWEAVKPVGPLHDRDPSLMHGCSARPAILGAPTCSEGLQPNELNKIFIIVAPVYVGLEDINWTLG